ncbi:uncharacterized protein LOC124829239 [Vigna umbellata]|uniref:uncharacterized protein LOC124829239 n=1 Tax=Vigna umbellata TaxID=87088 RepID=UPI001F5FA32D|nr:uncharacterized protein LOC124829239 [Vigna umbellata]
MGNSIRRVGLLSTVGAGEDEPFHYQLGRKVFVDLTERKFEQNRSGKLITKWIMSYTVDVSTCSFTLSISEEDGGAKGLLLQLLNVIPDGIGQFSNYEFDLDVQTVTESDALANPNFNFRSYSGTTTTSIEYGKQIHGGSVTNTYVCLFGSVDIGCLVVLENKRKIEEEGPYAVTVAHYIVTSAGINHYSGTRLDVGLSVVVKIGASNGNLDITVEGPDQHPPLGLRYLFGEALRTRMWKPSMCPHCYHKLRGKMFWQSDSEESDSVSMPLPRATPRNARGVSNGGRFKGNGNGNIYENNVMVFKRR